MNEHISEKVYFKSETQEDGFYPNCLLIKHLFMKEFELGRSRGDGVTQEAEEKSWTKFLAILVRLSL